MTTTETKSKKSKPSLKMEVCDGKTVFIIPQRTLQKFCEVREYCDALDDVPQLQNEVRGVVEAIDALMAKVK